MRLKSSSEPRNSRRETSPSPLRSICRNQSGAFAGIAESGTLTLVSGPDNPTTLNFLPDNHFIIVAASDIVGDHDSVWRKLRERYGKGVMPRTVNMITGPSRSGDIEQTLLLGAHGPRRLHIVIVKTM